MIDPKWKEQVSLTRPAFLARYDLTLFAKVFGGSDTMLQAGYDFLAKLSANPLNVYSSMTSLMSQLGRRGEVVAARFYSDEIVHLHHQGLTSNDFVIPKEGALVLPLLVVIPKGAKDADAAKPFLNALAEPTYQAPFLEQSGLLPSNPAVPVPAEVTKLLGGSPDEVMARSVIADWTLVAAEMETRTRRVGEIINKAR